MSTTKTWEELKKYFKNMADNDQYVMYMSQLSTINSSAANYFKIISADPMQVEIGLKVSTNKIVGEASYLKINFNDDPPTEVAIIFKDDSNSEKHYSIQSSIEESMDDFKTTYNSSFKDSINMIRDCKKFLVACASK